MVEIGFKCKQSGTRTLFLMAVFYTLVSRFVITNPLGELKQSYFYGSEARNLKSRHLKVQGNNPFLPLSFSWLLAFLGVPWLVAAPLHDLPQQSHGFLSCVYLQISPQDISQLDLGPNQPSMTSSLTNYICRDFPKKVMF